MNYRREPTNEFIWTTLRNIQHNLYIIYRITLYDKNNDEWKQLNQTKLMHKKVMCDEMH